MVERERGGGLRARARKLVQAAAVAGGVLLGGEGFIPLGEYSLDISALAQEAPDYAQDLKQFLKKTYGEKGQELRTALKAVLDSKGPMKTEIIIRPEEWKSYPGLKNVRAMKFCIEKGSNGETTVSLLIIDSNSPKPRSHNIRFKK